MKPILFIFLIIGFCVQSHAQKFTIKNIPDISQSADMLLDEANQQFWITESTWGEGSWDFSLSLYDYKGVKLNSQDPGVDSIFRISRDANNNLWCMGTQGVAFQDDEGWQYLYQGDGAGVMERIGDNMWLFYDYKIHKVSATDTVLYGAEDGLDGVYYLSNLAGGDNGIVWASTYEKLYKFNGSTWSLDTTFISSNIGGIHVDKNNTLWISLNGELYYRHQNEIDFTKVEMPFSEPYINSITSDKNGVLYLPTWQGLIIKYENTWAKLDTSNGLLRDDVYFVEVDNTSDLVFISSYYAPGISILINEDPFSNASPLKGIVYLDENNNGEYDSGEAGLGGHFVKLEPAGIFLSTGSNGEFAGQPTVGENSIHWIAEDFFEAGVTPVSYDFTYALGDTLYFEIGIKFKPVKDVSVYIAGSAVRPGFNTSMYLSYKNEGSVDLDTKVSFRFDPTLTFVGSSVTPTTIAENLLEWEITDLKSLERGFISVNMNLPASTPMGSELTNIASIEPSLGEVALSNNADTLNQIVTGSFDPNDKLVEEGVQEPGYRKIDFGLTYTIRFQNTGTDTAFFVKVIDTLDVNFDVSTFELLASSHDIDYSLNDRVMSFTFHDILLPDSTRDEPNSHGFIKYRIQNKAGIADNTVVTNSAAIYFDFNLPVLTNVVSNVYVNEIPQVITGTEPEVSRYYTVYPNPTNGSIMVQSLGNELLHGKIISSMGIPVKEFALKQANEIISLEALPSGVYFISVHGPRGYEIQKVIIR